jgi:uncharacterized protein YicC (UPF0701 family)
MSLKDKLKGAIFEDTPAKRVRETAPAEPKPTAPLIATSPVVYVPPETSRAYTTLKAATDFDTTIVGGALNKYLAPLKSLPMDEGLRIKTALAQAGAQEHITIKNLLDAFDSLIQALKDEESKFNAAIAKALPQIEDKKNEINSTSAQITALQKKVDQLTADVSAFMVHIDQTKTEFSAAMARRGAELAQQKAHYASLLQ